MSDDRKDLPPVNAPNFSEKLRETISTYLGNRGNKLDRGVTLRDLVDSKLISLRPSFMVGGGSSNPIAGPGDALVIPAAAVYEVDLTPPPTPTGFIASAAISNIFIEHAAPLYPQGHGHAKTVVYGATWTTGPLPTFTDAIQITEFSGTVFSHPTNPATTWHLWIKWQSVDGVLSASPAGGTNGAVVTTGQDVSRLVAALTGPGNPFKIVSAPITLADGTVVPVGTYTSDAYMASFVAARGQIGLLAVDDARIASLNVSKLTAGAINTGDITSTGTTVVGGTAVPSWSINGSTGLATFNNVVVRGTVYATAGSIGGITIADNAVRAGQTAYNTGSGFFLGANGTLSAGTAGGNRLTWDGENLNVVGTQFSLVNGAANFSGALNAASGTFSGSLSAATGTFSGNLTANAVNAVNTVNIAGEAVTIPRFASGKTPVQIIRGQGWQTVLSIPTMDVGTSSIVFVVSFSVIQNAAWCSARVLRNGAAVVHTTDAVFFPNYDGNTVSFSVKDTPGAAAYYDVQMVVPMEKLGTDGDYYSVTDRTVLALGAKR